MAFSFRAAFVFVDYQVNYELYSQVLCENKDKPQLQCNGKCHMMKEMAATNDTEEQGQTVEVFRMHFVEILQSVKETVYFKSCHELEFFTHNETVESLGYTPPTPPPQLV